MLNFLRKRVLRIVPGYVVAALLSTVVVGLILPGIPHLFQHFTTEFPVSLLLLNSPKTPPVLASSVNGSLWTIAYEFRCYLLVAVLGVIGALRRPVLVAGITLVLLAAWNTYALGHILEWHRFVQFTGEPSFVFRLTATYLLGACFYLFRKRVSFQPALAVSALILLGTLIFIPRTTELAVVLFGGYLLFYLGQLRVLSLGWFEGFPDVSYGIYLYGWPVQVLWIALVRGSPWVTFAVSTALCFALGWLSWHFIERPMLTFKRRSTVRLPPP